MSGDENTRFLIKRMDVLERRIMDKIEELQNFKNKAIGMAVIAGGIGSFVMELAMKLFL